MKLLITYDYGDEKMDAIRDLGYDVVYVREKEVQMNQRISEVDAMVCFNPFNSLDISALKNLKWIQLNSVGVDHIPINRIEKAGIILTNNKGGYSIPIGEWIVMKILEMYKHSRNFYRMQELKKWKTDTHVLEIYGKTIGFMGTGSIALEAAKRLKGFDVKILGFNGSGRAVPFFDRCYRLDKVHDMLSQCDVVVITIPYTEKTHHLIGESMISKMKDQVLLVNVSRGSIIEEESLIQYLKSGKIMGAALDVFEQEPLAENHPLWDLENVIITPHNSWISEMRNERRFDIIYENLKCFIQNKPLKNVVDLQKGY